MPAMAITNMVPDPCGADSMAKRVPPVPRKRSGRAASDEPRVFFGENFRRARISAGLTQIDVMARTGLDRSYVGKIEAGKANITLDTAKLLAELVGEDLAKLLQKPSKN
jgi:DNA-binding XRE family transcriptional regulator